MADYDVQYDRDLGDWGAKRAGADKAAGRYETQAAAYDAARGFAERSGGGGVRDHRKDNNRIRNTDTVGKKDPYPRRPKTATTGEGLRGCGRRLRCAAPAPVRGGAAAEGVDHRVSAANETVRM